MELNDTDKFQSNTYCYLLYYPLVLTPQGIEK